MRPPFINKKKAGSARALPASMTGKPRVGTVQRLTRTVTDPVADCTPSVTV